MDGLPPPLQGKYLACLKNDGSLDLHDLHHAFNHQVGRTKERKNELLDWFVFWFAVACVCGVSSRHDFSVDQATVVHAHKKAQEMMRLDKILSEGEPRVSAGPFDDIWVGMCLINRSDQMQSDAM